jgi:hypothetical protein
VSGNGCNLKGATPATAVPSSPHTVYLRCYRRLVGTLPHDMQVRQERASGSSGCTMQASILTQTPTFSNSNNTHHSVILQQYCGCLQQYLHDINCTSNLFVWCLQVTPALRLRVGAVPAAAAGLRIDMRTDSYFTDASSKDKAAGLGIPNTRAAYLVDPSAPPASREGDSEGRPSEGPASASKGGATAAAGGTDAPQFTDIYESPGWMVGHAVIFSVDRSAARHAHHSPLTSSTHASPTHHPPRPRLTTDNGPWTTAFSFSPWAGMPRWCSPRTSMSGTTPGQATLPRSSQTLTGDVGY